MVDLKRRILTFALAAAFVGAGARGLFSIRHAVLPCVSVQPIFAQGQVSDSPTRPLYEQYGAATSK